MGLIINTYSLKPVILSLECCVWISLSIHRSWSGQQGRLAGLGVLSRAEWGGGRRLTIPGSLSGLKHEGGSQGSSRSLWCQKYLSGVKISLVLSGRVDLSMMVWGGLMMIG